jgi:uncharacterized membrane protein
MTRHVAPAAAVLIALLFLVIPSFPRLAFLLDPRAPSNPMDMAFADHRPTGFLHIVPGLVMVALMPMQASRRLRQRWPAIHRWSGRLFVLVGLLVCASALIMNVRFPAVGGPLKRAVIYAMCAALLATMALGICAIRRRDVSGHRKWMVRAMGVALSSGSAGVFVVPFYLMGEMTDLVVGVGRWLGFLGTAATVEWWLRLGEAKRAETTRDDGGTRCQGVDAR